VFCERIDLPAADNQMVRDTDIHQLKYLNQSLREGLSAWLGVVSPEGWLCASITAAALKYRRV
jgi:hypothetical protein